MTISLKHAFTSPVTDQGNADEVGPDEWNAEHTLTQAADRILGRVTAGAGATEELTAAQVRTLLDLEIGTDVQAWDAQLDSLSSASANGVSLVTAADYAAMRGLLDLEAGTDFYSISEADAAFQPLDSDLTAIAALTTQSFGRALLEDASAADTRDALDAAPYVASRTALKALDTSKDTVAYLKEAGREGWFVFDSSNLSTEVTADTQEGIYVSSGDGSSGAWVRQYNKNAGVNITWFGAVANGSTNNATALAAALAASLVVYIPRATSAFNSESELTLSSGHHIYGAGKNLSVIKFVSCDGFTSGNGNQRVHLHDFAVTGNQTSGTFGVHLLGNERSTIIERLRIYQFGAVGVGAGIKLETVDTGDMWGGSIRNNEIEDCGLGIHMDGARLWTLQDNVIRLCEGSPLYMQDCKAITLIGGGYENSNATHGATSSYAIECHDCAEIKALGIDSENVIDGFILLDNSSDCIFDIYTQTCTGTDAIYVELVNGSSRNRIYGSTGRVFNAGQTGVSIASGCDDNDIAITINRDSGGLVGTAISDAGSDNRYRINDANSGSVTTKGAVGPINVAANGNITGAGTFSGSTSSAFAGLQMTCTDAGSSAGPDFTTFRDSSSPAASDNLGRFVFNGRDSSGAAQNYAIIVALITDPTAGSEDGALRLQTVVNGSINDRMRIQAGVFHPSATGGDKGDNTINFGAVYDDNSLLTDYVFDKWLGVEQTYSPRVQEKADQLDPAMFSVEAHVTFMRENRRLYGMPDLDDCIDGIVKEKSLGEMVQLLWQSLELAHIHIAELHERLKSTEA